MQDVHRGHKENARRLHNGFVDEVKRQNKGKANKVMLPIGFYKTGSNRFVSINTDAQTLDVNQVLNEINHTRSANIFYYNQGELSHGEKIDRIKLETAIEDKLKGIANIQIVITETGIAITVLPAKVVFVFPVLYKVSESELVSIAETTTGPGNVGEVVTIAKSNFADLDKLAAQIKRYKGQGYIIIENAEL